MIKKRESASDKAKIRKKIKDRFKEVCIQSIRIYKSHTVVVIWDYQTGATITYEYR